MPEPNARPLALVVDDEPDLRTLIALTLAKIGVDCDEAATLAEARALVDSGRHRLCLCDLRLPDGSGIELLEHIQAHRPELPVAMITAHATVKTAIAALKGGAFDFVLKPVALPALRDLVRSALRLGDRTSAGTAEGVVFVGASPHMRELRATVAKVARSQAPVLVVGESGTGKELVARLLHAQGSRAAGPFVPVNCGAIPEALLESELFGHRKGAFTGASSDRIGLFQAAAGGTLFLDEIAELPLPMQVRLLRALQERAVRPVGAEHEVPVDVRVISATHQDLGARVREGRFRQDLYYRINVITLDVPPLRARREDLPELATYLLSRISPGSGVRLAPAALEALAHYDFPGNVRELENILERAVALREGGEIGAADLALPEGDDAVAPQLQTAGPRAAEGTLESQLEDLERDRIKAALESTRWNRTAAAARLGITLRALRYRMQKLGLG